MPGLAQRNEQQSNGSFGFWSKNSEDVSYNQLQKFWSELSPKARQELLRIDKQTLFEQARKNMYCSRCNGLLLEGFLQIIMYGKSLQQEGVAGNLPCNRSLGFKYHNGSTDVLSNGCPDEMQDPSVHPWGGLTTTRDGSLTLLDCYLCSKSLKGLQNVFDSACARERERELLYPDACGGGGRGWISQGMASYGRVHGTRETCALHTARLSCDTLVDFWSALGDETRESLLRMKEEDFIERLMYRFDSKRFCRDCRRNVIREFKELKELKRMRREPRCTSWFCVADIAFQYEVSIDTVQADWRQTFADTVGTFHHFEWAIGTGEGKCDILDFENVGMNGSVQVNGLDLRGLSACYITLRAFKLDGRCTELCVKAHALKGQQCVHCRLVVGDGFVSIKRGESIRRFFEHAEEAEEEEDEDLMDKDGNELDGECSRPQKHAKSPELAREFLLDASTVIFKEQVEKAFREGTARQNAHSIFVCLALKLLEERVHVACKEIITLEKQMKLLEEEEKEKREEEERKERKRIKEREKKLRRKERLKGKERAKEKKSTEANDNLNEEHLQNIDEKLTNAAIYDGLANETGVALSRPGSSEHQEEQVPNGCCSPKAQDHPYISYGSEDLYLVDEKDSFIIEQSRVSHQRSKHRKPDQPSKLTDRHRHTVVSENASFVSRSEARYRSDRFDIPSRCFNGSNRQLRVSTPKTNGRNGIKVNEKFQRSSNRMGDRYDFHFCNCKQHNEYRAKVESNVSTARTIREPRPVSRSDSVSDISKSANHTCRYSQAEYMRDGSFVRPKTRTTTVQSLARDPLTAKKVWEPMEKKKYPRSNSDSDVTLRFSASKADGNEQGGVVMSSNDMSCPEGNENSVSVDEEYISTKKLRDSIRSTGEESQSEIHVQAKNVCYSTEPTDKEVGSPSVPKSTLNVISDPMMGSSSNSDNCSSCLSEGDSQAASSNNGNSESSSTSDSEDGSQHSRGRENSACTQNGFIEHHENQMGNIQGIHGREVSECGNFYGPPLDGAESRVCGAPTTVPFQNPDNGAHNLHNCSGHQGIFQPMINRNMQFPVFQAPSTIGFYQNPVSWPANPASGLMSLPHPNQYLYSGPLGYGANGNSPLCMQYNGLHPSAMPFLSSGPIPVFHPVNEPHSMRAEEHTHILEAGMTPKAPIKTKAEKLVVPAVPSPERECGKSDDSVKFNAGNDNGFSLFHFGGPAALCMGCKSDPLLSKDGMLGDLSSQFLADHIERETAYTKKEKENTIEEYNLFAAGNGLKFSFF